MKTILPLILIALILIALFLLGACTPQSCPTYSRANYFPPPLTKWDTVPATYADVIAYMHAGYHSAAVHTHQESRRRHRNLFNYFSNQFSNRMTRFNLIIPEFNGRAVAQRYYSIVHPERKYTSDKAWRQLKQDKKLQERILAHVVKEFHDRQQKIIAKYFADVKVEQ